MIGRDRLIALLSDVHFLAWGTARGLLGGGCPRSWGDGWQSAAVSADRLIAMGDPAIEHIWGAAERHALDNWPRATAAQLNRIPDTLARLARAAADGGNPEFAALIRRSIRDYWSDVGEIDDL